MVHLTHFAPPAQGVSSQTVLDTITRLCPDLIAAMQAFIAIWRARFWQVGWQIPPSGRGAVTA
jgi:hypothetical protein